MSDSLARASVEPTLGEPAPQRGSASMATRSLQPAPAQLAARAGATELPSTLAHAVGVLSTRVTHVLRAREPDATPPLVAPASAEERETPVARLRRELAIEPAIGPGLDAAPRVDDDAPRYALGEELGKGGGGIVRAAVDRDLQRTVAIKTLATPYLGSALHVQAFVEEAIITAGLDHPGIVTVHDLGVSPEAGLYYSMKRLRGRPLSRVLKRLRAGDPELGAYFTLSRLLGCFVELCRAIAYAHERGVIHTDLKPDNIIVGPRGEIVVVDWGLALVMGPSGRSQARSKLLAGTPEYMAPEQLLGSGEALDERVDVWALGVILYELLTLRLPYRGGSIRGLVSRLQSERLVPPRERAPEREIPEDLERVCLRALTLHRERRYASVAQLLRDVDDHLEGSRARARQLALSQRATQRVQGWLDEAERRERGTSDASAAAGVTELYARSVDALLRALEQNAEPGPIESLAGELYWRIFTSAYSERARAERSVTDRRRALLTRLSQRVLPAIVRVGRARARARGPLTLVERVEREEREDDASAWLSIVEQLCQLEPRARADAFTGLPALSPLVRRIHGLRGVPLFREMKPHSLLQVADACEDQRFAPGETIFAQGEADDALCVLLEGAVDILRDGQKINTLGPGECVGEIAALGDSTRTASVVANAPVTCVLLAGSRFRELVGSCGEIGLALVTILNQRLRVATEREAALRGQLSARAEHA